MVDEAKKIYMMSMYIKKSFKFIPPPPTSYKRILSNVSSSDA